MEIEISKGTRKCGICNKMHIKSGDKCAVFNYRNGFGSGKISYSINCLQKFANKKSHSKTYSRKEVAVRMELAYNKALFEIHHPFFDKDQWIQENI